MQTSSLVDLFVFYAEQDPGVLKALVLKVTEDTPSVLLQSQNKYHPFIERQVILAVGQSDSIISKLSWGISGHLGIHIHPFNRPIKIG